MKRLALALALLSTLSTAAQAETGGCLKYGAAGAVAGHFVGEGNKLTGALAGCAAGIWARRRAKAQAAEKARQDAEYGRHAQAERDAYPRYQQQNPGYHAAPPPLAPPGPAPSPWTNPGAYAPR